MGKLADDLKQVLLATETPVATSGLGRLWKTGRSAAGLASAMLGGRFRGRGSGLGAADLAAITKLVSRLGELRGVAMKAGQILSYVDPSLDPELRALLSLLQTAAPASPFVDVERTLRSSFGDRAEPLLAGLTREPVAVASIGQVHRVSLPDGRELALKVLHPGIANALRSDFRAAGSGAALAATLAGGLGATVHEFVDEARTALLEECDYTLEASRQRTFTQLFEGDPDLVVPAVIDDWCAPAVLATEWRPGLPLDAWLATSPTQAARDRAGAALFRFYFGTLYRHGLFHADPHPGNYGFLPDGRIVVYDFGCVRTFDRPTTHAFASLADAVRRDDSTAIALALEALGGRRPASPESTATARRLLRSYFSPLLRSGPCSIAADEGFEARQAMQDKFALAALRLPGRLLFLFRLRFGLYAVLSRLGAVVDWSALESAWATDVLTRSGAAS